MLVRDLFGKKLNELTNEELKEYRRRVYEKRRLGNFLFSYNLWQTSPKTIFGRKARI